MIDHIKAVGPNSDEIEYWNSAPGQNWVNQNRLTDLMYQQFGDLALKRAAPMPGEHVLDIGCGCGTTTLAMSELLTPNGSITGLDVSELMLAVARKRNESAGVPVNFINADAETYDLGTNVYDLLFSQFGVMFFANPDAAFANFFKALKPDGRLAFVCWRGPDESPWSMEPFYAVRPFKPEMPVPSPESPASPFSFESKEKVSRMLDDIGFVDVQFDLFDTVVQMGDGSLGACVEFVAAFNGPISGLLRSVDETKKAEIIEVLQTAMAPYHTGKHIEFDASAWIVSARRGD